MAKTYLWNEGWEFQKTTLELKEPDRLENEKWQSVDIPHDWLIYQTEQLYEDGVGWYRKCFIWENNQEQAVVRFDGVYMDSIVIINGCQAGEWKYGYSTFEVDITQYLIEGTNEIIVRVVHQSPNSRWYSGAGIYRNVWLKYRLPDHLVSDGIYITPVKLDNSWRVEVDTEISLKEGKAKGLRQTILDGDGLIVGQVTEDFINRGTESSELKRKKTDQIKKCIISQCIGVEAPRLWDIGKGNLYTLRTELLLGEDILECEEQKFGFRTLTFDPKQGFLINDRHLKIYGVCEHHDLGCMGAAFNTAAMRRKFRILRQMGVNAVRTSHNMPAPELMELADEMGFLIVSEAFDMWERAKTPYDYARFFPEWMEMDVASWVLRDRNHPSVIMWSIGNEIYDTHVDKRGQEVTLLLKEAVEKHDYKRHAPVTIGSNYMQGENAQACAELIGAVGYNYAERLYQNHHAAHPEWVIYGSETSSVISSRNIYHFPFEKQILEDDDEQCSALGNSTTGWGASSFEKTIIDERDNEFSMGQFIWTGFDYIGEPTPYQTKNSYFGQIDTAGFPKDSFYIFQAGWTDYKTAPMVHVFPYWDFNEGQLIDVQICSNAPRVELFVNGLSKGDFAIDYEKGCELLGHWKVAFEPGELKAVAYDEMGRVIAEDVRSSFTDACSLTLSPDKEVLMADGRDLIFIEISAVDKDDYYVENARNRVHVQVSGAGRLIGLDNGDSTDFDQYKGKSRRLFGGKLLAVIAAKLEPGDIKIEVSSPEMETKELTLKAIAVESVCHLSAIEENQERKVVAGGIGGAEIEDGNQEIPIRKISLVSDGGKTFDAERNQITVKAVIHPKNATYGDLEWRVVTDSGIDSSLALLEEGNGTARITAIGDGDFRVRCIAKNGGTIASVQSALEFHAEGFGNVTFNPYEEICAGLCSYREGNVIEGIEHGMNFVDFGEGIIGFEHVDFGNYGSDEVTIQLFVNYQEPVYLQIWEGKLGEADCELLADMSYLKPLRWMEFQPETYKLKKRVRGVKSIYLVTKQAFQIRGLSFTKLDKAFETLLATENDRIYGDTFTVTSEEVLGIGNNVTLEYDDLDFGAKGIRKMVLCGRSELENNTIQIRFVSENGEISQTAEFSGCSEYTEREFNLEQITGVNKIRIIFLPGCNFDFKWFRFIEG